MFVEVTGWRSLAATPAIEMPEWRAEKRARVKIDGECTSWRGNGRLAQSSLDGHRGLSQKCEEAPANDAHLLQLRLDTVGAVFFGFKVGRHERQ
jgi:hypothetical protein